MESQPQNPEFRICPENFHPCLQLGYNCIQNFHLGRYIVGAVKRDFRMYIRRYTSRNENYEYGYPHSNTLLQFRLKL